MPVHSDMTAGRSPASLPCMVLYLLSGAVQFERLI